MRNHTSYILFLGCIVFWQSKTSSTQNNFPGRIDWTAKADELSFRLSTNVTLFTDHQETIT